jgi:PAS domain S-box-containing protein
MWIGPNGSLRYCSPGCERVTGYKDSEIMASPDVLVSMALEEDRDKVARHIHDEEKAATGTFRLDFCIRTRGGKRKWISHHCRPILGEGGTFQGRRVSNCDISREKSAEKKVPEERAQAEETLRALSLRQEAILHAVPDIIMEVDPDKVYTWANPAGLAFFGRDVIGKEAAFYFEGEQDTYSNVQSLFNGDEGVVYVESWQRRQDGERRLLAWWCRVLKDRQGKVSGALSTARDITEQKDAEEALRQSEARYRRLLHSVTGYVYSVNLDAGRALTTSHGPGCTAVTGYAPEDYAADAYLWYRMIQEEDRERVEQSIRSLLTGETPPPLEHRIHHLDGSLRWIRHTLVPHSDPAGRLLGYDGLIEDITERKRAEEAFRESEERYRVLVESSLMGIGISSGNRIVYANQALLNLFGYDDREEFIKTPLIDHVAPESREFISNRRDKVARGEPVPVEFEYDILRKDGLTRTLLATSSRFILEGRLYTQTTFQDITERKRAEEALRESEERFRRMFQNSAAGMVLVDPGFRFLQANESYCRMLGYSESELRNRTFQDVTHPDDQTIGIELTRQVLAGKREGFQIEKRYIRKDGTVVWGLVSSTLIRDAQGKPLHFITQIQDITERRRAEEALRESEERFRLLVENAPDAILVLRDRRLTYVNPAAVRLFAATAARELLGQGYLDRVHPDHRESCALRITAVLERHTAVPPAETRYLRLDGSTVDVEATAVPCVYEGMRAIMVSARDLSERRRAAEERGRLEAQLQQARRLEAVGLLAGGIAHDFNNMLAVIMGYAEALRGELPPDSNYQDEIAEIVKAASRSGELTRQLLAFARRQTLEMRPLDLNRVVLDLESMLRRTVRENITIDLRLSPSLSAITADRGQIEQILLNLALNSQYAMPEGGKLTIETSDVLLEEAYTRAHADVPAGRYVLLIVSDTGVGMDRRTQERIFEPFFTTKPIGEGTGLGLPTVYGIVKQHGGNIEVQSEVGKGSSFRIYFPRSDAPAESPDPRISSRSPRGNETVLVVEDQEELRKLVCRTLTNLGYTILEAADGNAALQAASAHSGIIHLVVTDVIMAGLNGRELYERLSELRTGIKVLFMSGYAGSVITQYGIQDKGVDLILKPFSTQAFVSKVREVLDRK